MSAKVIPFVRCGCGRAARPIQLFENSAPDCWSCNECSRQTYRTIKRCRPVARVLQKIGMSEEIVRSVMLHLYEEVDAEYDARRQDQS